MQKHKWYNEIVAWAAGAEIEWKSANLGRNEWVEVGDKNPMWHRLDIDFRIKPQPKEPQYLYVWKPYEEGDDLIISDRKPKKNDIVDDGIYKLIGKIKLEQYDE